MRAPDYRQLSKSDDLRISFKESSRVLLGYGKRQRELQPGDRMTLERGDVAVVVEGEVLVQHRSGSQETVDAPGIVGMVEALAGEEGISLQALTEVHLLVLDMGSFEEAYKEVPWVRDYLKRLYEFTIRDLREQLEDYETHLDDFFLPHSARFLPGPYKAGPVSLYLLAVEANEPGQLRSALPPGMRLFPGTRGRYLLVLSDFQNMTSENAKARGEAFNYQETAVFIPCWGRGGMGFFVPVLFPNNYLAIILGREIYGFPKRFGETEIDPGDRRAQLQVEKRLAFWLRWKDEEELDARGFFTDFMESYYALPRLGRWAGGLYGRAFPAFFPPAEQHTWPPLPVYVRKFVPAAGFPHERRILPRVDRLVRIPFEMWNPGDFRRLREAELEFFHSDFVYPGRLLWAGRMTLHMRFNEAVEVREYTGWMLGARLLARRLRWREAQFRSARRAVLRLLAELPGTGRGPKAGGGAAPRA